MGNFRQLTDIFTPTHYDLTLDLNREKRTFSGTVQVHGTLKADTPIVFHAKELSITTVTIDDTEATFKAGDNDELICEHGNLTAGNHVITIEYTGVITDAMHGLYPCYYEVDGKKHELLATQFESHHAREVFPCIDEPAGKATFDVTLTTEKDIVVLGNMPAKYQDVQGERLTTTFETTPIMSPYLLAFVTGDLQKKSMRSKKGVEVNVYATKAQPADSLDFALDVGAKVVDYYGDYFDTDYPLSKCDHVALPDFSSGAMENWGLITYREVALLAGSGTSINARHYIATVIAHEVAHQWFGNLVTMQWWNDLWLNESFATLMEYLSVDALWPEWNMWRDFATNEAIAALRRDAMDGVQAVQVDVTHPDEISTIFDPAIVYAKGARLLRMVQHYIGHEAFQQGLKQYFTKHAYGNTVGNDLWQELSDASGKDIVSMMNTWTAQPGYPVVRASLSGDTVTLTQEQFFIGSHDDSQRLWPIPLNASDNYAPALFDTKELSFDINSSAAFSLNVGDTAHFITHYDEALLERLITAVREGTLDELGRLQLLNEATLLARANILPSHSLLSLLDAYKNETSEAVWTVISLAVGELKKFVQDDETIEKKLRKFAGNISSTMYTRLGWTPRDGESEDDTKLRGTILGMTLYSENPEAIKIAEDMYHRTQLEDLDPELRPLIISSVARYGNREIVDHLLERYKASQSAELKQDICLGVTSTRIPEKITELLEIMTDTSVVKPQDVSHWYVYLIRGRESREYTWQWLRNNWGWIEETFGGDKSYDTYPRYTASGLYTKEHLAQYHEFFDPLLSVTALTRSITLGASEIEARVELIERDQQGVIDALHSIDAAN